MKKGRDIIMSVNNNEEVFVLPIVPDIEVSSPQKNEEFETADKGSLQLIGKPGLRTFSISSIFPAHKVPGMRPGAYDNPYMYIDRINWWRTEQIPIRVIASLPGGRVWFNLPMTIDDFSYHISKAGHVVYNLELTEYVWYRSLI